MLKWGYGKFVTGGVKARSQSPIASFNFLSGSLPANLTFSRSSSATQYDATGKVVYAPENLVAQSQDFTNAAWSHFNSTPTAIGGLAPDGTSSAQSLIEDTTASTNHYLIQALSVPAGTPLTASIYVKNGSSDRGVEVRLQTASGGAAAIINPLTGAIAQVPYIVFGSVYSNLSYKITNLGNGWSRFSLSATSSEANPSMYVFLANGTSDGYTGNGASYNYIWGAQVEHTSYSSPVAYNLTTSVAYYAPRFDYDPVSHALRGYLTEESRTNLKSISSGSTTNTMSIGGTAVTRGSGAANSSIVLGGTPGTLAKAQASAGARGQDNFVQASGVAVTISAYLLKPLSFNGEYVCFGDNNNGANFLVFNPFTGVASSVGANIVSYAIRNVGTWWRVEVTYTSTNTTGTVQFYPAFNTDGTANEMTAIGTGYAHTIDGIQCEQGSFASSLIITTASAVTRAQDNCYTLNTSYFNPLAGTLLTTGSVMGISGFAAHACFNDGTTNNEIYLASNNAGYSGLQPAANAAVAATGGGAQGGYSLAIGAVAKMGVSFDGATYTFYVNGTADGTFALGIPAVNQLRIGGRGNQILPLNGWVQSVSYYNSRLSNAQLQALTV